MKKKNSFIELLRFIFCLVIFLHHSGFYATDSMSYPFKSAGFFAVEFFFLLTGAFATAHMAKGAPSNGCMIYSMDYTIGKLKRVFPYAATGILLSYGWYFLQADPSLSIKDRIFGRWNILYELLFLPMTGIMDIRLESYMNTPLWYLSVILIALPLVMYLVIKCKDLFTHYLSWLLPLLIHGLLIQKYGSIGNWGEYTLIAYSGVIRGLADLMLGCFVYEMSLSLSRKKTKIPKWIWTVAEAALYIFALYTFNTEVDGYTYEFAVLCVAVGLIITLSGVSLTGSLAGNTNLNDVSKGPGALGKFFNHLGALSLPIYCLHWPVYRFMTLYLPNLSYVWAVVIAFAICVALSELIMVCVKRFAKRA